MSRRVQETVEEVTIGTDSVHVWRRTYTDWVLNFPARITGGWPVVRFGIDDAVAGSFELVTVGDRQVALRSKSC